MPMAQTQVASAEAPRGLPAAMCGSDSDTGLKTIHSIYVHVVSIQMFIHYSD